MHCAAVLNSAFSQLMLYVDMLLKLLCLKLRETRWQGARSCTIRETQNVLQVAETTCVASVDNTLTELGGVIHVQVTGDGLTPHSVPIRVWTPEAPTLTLSRTMLRRVANWTVGASPNQCVPLYQDAAIRATTVFHSGNGYESATVDVTDYAYSALRLSGGCSTMRLATAGSDGSKRIVATTSGMCTLRHAATESASVAISATNEGEVRKAFFWQRSLFPAHD